MQLQRNAEGRSRRTGAGTVMLAVAAAAAGLACDSPSPETSPLPASHDLLFDGDTPELESPVFTLDAVTLTVNRLTPALTGNRARPSPDGTRIVVQSTGDASTPPYLRILEAGAAEAVRFGGTTSAWEREATWSPDGLRIAFNCDVDDPYGDILVADVVGSALVGLTNLTLGAGLVPDVTPAWSPDGRWIAFTSYRGDDVAIWKMRPDGTGAVKLTAGEGDDYFPTWSPDGSRIAFQRNTPREGGVAWRLGIVSADGGEPRLVASDDDLGNPAWHPAADLIAVVARAPPDGERDVRVIAPDGTTVTHVSRPGVDRHPAWRRRAP